MGRFCRDECGSFVPFLEMGRGHFGIEVGEGSDAQQDVFGVTVAEGMDGSGCVGFVKGVGEGGKVGVVGIDRLGGGGGGVGGGGIGLRSDASHKMLGIEPQEVVSRSVQRGLDDGPRCGERCGFVLGDIGCEGSS